MDFTVPGAADSYAPEVYYLGQDGTMLTDPDDGVLATPLEVQANIITLPTDALIQFDILKNGADKALEASWVDGPQHAEVGLALPTAMSRWDGVRIRAKSGGTGGAAEAEVRAV